MAKGMYEFDAAVNSSLEYGFKWPLQDGESIVQSTWTVLAGAVTVVDESLVENVTSAFLHPVIVGTVVRVVNEITTDNVPPRVDSRMLVLSVKRR